MSPKRIHLIGIAGAGMASLADYLVSAGYSVSGSDRSHGPAVGQLERNGAQVTIGHDPRNIEYADMVVASDAIPLGNIEWEAAQRRGIEVLRRAECLNWLGRDRRTIMVAGSHGKSTTGGMISAILDVAGLDPGFILGADVPCLGDLRARFGGSDIIVIEACEAFRNLDCMAPHIAVITNIDDEHVNHYGSQSALDNAFVAFAHRAQTTILCGSDEGVGRLHLTGPKFQRFGSGSDDVVSSDPWPMPFRPRIENRILCEIALRQPGQHMRRNALAAIATCHALGVSTNAIVEGLERFTGVARRWQDLGEAAGIRVIDDYAHHPAEIAATLQAAQAIAPERRLVAAFQPQLHSRVQRLQKEFARSLMHADKVLLLDVDANGEEAHSVGSGAIADLLQDYGKDVVRREDAEHLLAHIKGDLSAGDMLLVMGGAGMGGAAEQIREALLEQSTHAISNATFRPRMKWVDRLRDRLPGATTFISLFRSRARSMPDAPALIGRDGPLKYAELDRMSDELAAGLATKGLCGSVIGVSLPLGMELITTVLGVMKAGGTYLPIDLSVPEERRAYMLEKSEAKVLITKGTASKITEVTPAALRSLGGAVPPAPRAVDNAYICFTSGSTGYPKGVRIRHRALASLLRSSIHRFAIKRSSRMLLNTSIGFDVSLAEICSTLAAGGTLAIAGTRPLGGKRLVASLEQLEVSHLAITPSLLATARPRSLPQLRCIIAAGEACPSDLIKDWGTGRRFFNAYGPTEATIYATAALCKPGEEVSIGKALRHVEAHVLDEDLRPVANGGLGELCLSGPGVAESYIGDSEETAKRFARAMIGRRAADLYRTGDMVRRKKNGTLSFVGRADSQVKIHGMRIELNEIERVAMRLKGVSDAAACLSTGQNPTVNCFIKAEDGEVLDRQILIQQFARWLPEGAVPSRIVPVPHIPLTASGKKDRRRLIEDHGIRAIERAPEHWPPRSKIEKSLASLWQQALAFPEPVGRLDRFASLGGDSLASLILIQLVEERFNISVPPGYFGRIGGLAQMATQIDELLWQNKAAVPVIDGFKGSRIYRRMRDLTATWPGSRFSADHLISSVGGLQATQDIFFCCQTAEEFKTVASHIPPNYRFHAMRSGHLVIDNASSEVHQLASHYAAELNDICPSRPIILAGVCQGGAIARTAAEILIAEGRDVPLLVLIESGRPQPYQGRAALIWTEDSFLNPLRENGPGIAPYQTTIAGGASFDFVPGIHGDACRDPSAAFLAHHMRHRIEEALRLQSSVLG